MADYTPTAWTNGSTGGTPLTAAELNRIENGVALRGNIRRLTKTSSGWPTRPAGVDYAHWVGPSPAPTGFVNGDTWSETDPFYPIVGTVVYSFNDGLMTPTVTTSVNGSQITNALLTSATITSALAYPTSGVLQLTTATTNQTTTTRYFEITLAVDATWKLNSLTFLGARGGASTPRGLVVRSSADSYASVLSGGGEFTTTRPTWATYTIDVSSIAANRTTPLTFRFYPFAPAQSTSVEIDDITFSVTAVAA